MVFCIEVTLHSGSHAHSIHGKTILKLHQTVKKSIQGLVLGRGYQPAVEGEVQLIVTAVIIQVYLLKLTIKLIAYIQKGVATHARKKEPETAGL